MLSETHSAATRPRQSRTKVGKAMLLQSLSTDSATLICKKRKLDHGPQDQQYLNSSYKHPRRSDVAARQVPESSNRFDYPQKTPWKTTAKAPEEKRLRVFRKHAPKTFLERLERVRTQRMFLINRERRMSADGEQEEETFDIAGTTGNIYSVNITKAPTCTCPDNSKGNQCKHIVYSNEDIVWCQAACGNNIHRECFETWARSKPGKVKCVYCRAPWAYAADDDVLRHVSRTGKKNAEGYVNVASELGLSGERDMSSYNQFWVQGQRGYGRYGYDDVYDGF